MSTNCFNAVPWILQVEIEICPQIQDYFAQASLKQNHKNYLWLSFMHGKTKETLKMFNWFLINSTRGFLNKLKVWTTMLQSMADEAATDCLRPMEHKQL